VEVCLVTGADAYEVPVIRVQSYFKLRIFQYYIINYEKSTEQSSYDEADEYKFDI
jgi:hypothetical protein